MNIDRQQLIETSILALDEFGYLQITDPDPKMGKLGTFALWSAALKNLSDQEIAAAFDWAISNWTNAFNQKISPGDLIKFVKDSTESSYGEMWQEINSRKWDSVNGVFNREIGECVKYKFAPEVQAVISQMGGIEVFLSMTTAQERQLFAQFRDVVANNNKRAKEANYAGPLLEAKKHQNNLIQLQAAKSEIEQRKQAKEEKGQVSDAMPIIDGIKAQFAKKQIIAQQVSREQKKAEMEAYAKAQGIEVKSLLSDEFWKQGQQELAELDSKIESMSQAMKGLKVV